MALGKQAKILSPKQITAVQSYLATKRNGLRDQVIFLLSVKAGLRAKEIAFLSWAMVLTAEGQVDNSISLTDKASKGRSGRVIPINAQLKTMLEELLNQQKHRRSFDPKQSRVITTERSNSTTAQVIVSMFYQWYRDIGLIGCSSHSGRRTFITNAARKIGSVGGSLRDVQALAGHSSLAVTQRYIEGDAEARTKVVQLL